MTDLVVAGGGPVGLATAIEARLAGLDVVLLEPRPGPVDKACGEGLMPTAVAALARLGVQPPGRPFHGIRYLSGHRVAEARFRHGPGRGVRRTALHDALSARADRLGVARVAGRVDGVEQDEGGVRVAGLQARWLVAADGLHSPVRRGLGLDAPDRRAPARYGLRRHWRVQPWTDLVEVHWSATAEAYVTPVGDDLVGVAILAGPGGSYDEALAGFPALAGRLAGAEPVSQVRGAGPLRQSARARRAGRVLLAGDAAGYVDALTGEGIATGLATARAAVACIAAGRPEDYDRAWRAATRRYRLLTSGLLRAAQSRRLRAAVVPAAAGLPRVFGWAVDQLA